MHFALRALRQLLPNIGRCAAGGLRQALVLFQREQGGPAARVVGQQLGVLRPFGSQGLHGVFPLRVSKVRRRLGAGGGLGNFFTQFLNALPLAAHGGNHGYAQMRLQSLGVQGQAQLPGNVYHVQRQHDGAPQLHELKGEQQAALQIGGIHHVHDDIGLLVEQKVARYALLGREGGQRIRAGQVHDFDPLPGMAVVAAFFIDGYAGVVGNVLLQAREGVEQGGLAGVLLAGQGDQEFGFFFAHALTRPARQSGRLPNGAATQRRCLRGFRWGRSTVPPAAA